MKKCKTKPKPNFKCSQCEEEFYISKEEMDESNSKGLVPSHCGFYPVPIENWGLFEEKIKKLRHVR